MSQASERAASLALRAIYRRGYGDRWVSVYDIARDVWGGEPFPVSLTEGTLGLLLHRGLVARTRGNGTAWVLWRLTGAGRRALASEEGSV